MLSPPVASGHQYCEVFGEFTHEQARTVCHNLGDGYGLAEFTQELDWTEFTTNFQKPLPISLLKYSIQRGNDTVKRRNYTIKRGNDTIQTRSC